MTERVRKSIAKQEALMRLMSDDPSLMGSIDVDVLASLTLASAPVNGAASAMRKSKDSPESPQTTTLLDPRLSLSTSHRTSMCSPSRPSTSRANMQLYAADDIAIAAAAPSPSPSRIKQQKHVLHHSTSAPPASDRHARSPHKLVSLLDASVFAQYGGLKMPAATAAAPNQMPLPPTRSSGRSNSKTKQTTKANARRCAITTPPRVPVLAAPLTADELYETNSYAPSNVADTTEQSVVESTHSSSHESFDSDDSSATAVSSSTTTKKTVSLVDLPAPPLGRSRASPSPLVLDHRCFVARSDWVVKSVRRACAVCERDFGVLRPRHSCRMCGEVICSRCSVFRAVNLAVVANKCRICACCSVSYRKKLDELVASGSSGNTATMATGSDSAMEPTLSTAPLVSSTDEPAQLTASSLSSLQRQRSADDTDDLNLNGRDGSDVSTLLTSDYSVYSSASLSCASDVSLASSTTSLAFANSTAHNRDDELAAARRAQALEREVDASRQRIADLERSIATSASQQAQLSTEQQQALADARRVIMTLQQQLHAQEQTAREAAATRDSLCLANLRQTATYSTDDDARTALEQKLRVLERQLALAGISAAEVIPYSVARAKVREIALQLQALSASGAVDDATDAAAQAAARREAFALEQAMEKYNTALVMTDEYAAEQQRNDDAFEAAQSAANVAALALVRSAVPVDVARLSEQQLVERSTPSGVTMSRVLAKRLKRTNILTLVRVAPNDIVRMHPSVIDALRTSGLSLFERRALHVALQEPARMWKRQQRDDSSQKKLQWFTHLRDALVAAVTSYEQHCAPAASGDTDTIAPLSSDTSSSSLVVAATHTCSMLGLACPVRADARVEALYAVGLGFPTGDVFATVDVVKSEPDGAGEKARREAQTYARELVANERQRALKTHYRTRMRDVAMALGALEDVDAALEKLDALDAKAWAIPVDHSDDKCTIGEQHVDNDAVQQLARVCEQIVFATRELAMLLAKRAGICVVGKRNAANDVGDTRSRIECCSAEHAVAIALSLLDDVRTVFDRYRNGATTRGALQAAVELLDDVRNKNVRALEVADGSDNSVVSASSVDRKHQQRVPWSQRVRTAATAMALQDASGRSDDAADATRIPDASTSALPHHMSSAAAAVLPTSASLFDAIRARKLQKQKQHHRTTAVGAAAASDTMSTAPAALGSKAEAACNAKPPLDLFAAIRARQAKLAAALDATAAADTSTTSA